MDQFIAMEVMWKKQLARKGVNGIFYLFFEVDVDLNFSRLVEFLKMMSR